MISLSPAGPSIFRVRLGELTIGQVVYDVFEINRKRVAVCHITLAPSYRGNKYSKETICALASATKLPVWSADRARAAGAPVSGTIGLGRNLWDSLNSNGMPGYTISDDEIMEA